MHRAGRGQVKQQLKTEFRGREVTAEAAERLRLEASIGVEVTRILESRARAMKPIDAPDRMSVRKAIDAVEGRIVEALWTLARLPNPPGPEGAKKHGIEYIQEQADRWHNAVQAKGWEDARPRPSLPTARQIDAMHEPLEWLTTRFLPIETCKLLTAAASTKRGDPARQVAWARVRDAMPELACFSRRTLARKYEDGCRQIVAVLAGRGA